MCSRGADFWHVGPLARASVVYVLTIGPDSGNWDVHASLVPARQEEEVLVQVEPAASHCIVLTSACP